MMAACSKLDSQLRKVKKLSIEGHPQVAGLVTDRLVAAEQVDDREPIAAEGQTGFGMRALVVGAAMGDGLEHRSESFGRERASAP